MADLIPVYEPLKATGKPRIVFIHGLDGDIRKTWMSNPMDEKSLWPRWVGEDTGCPVWLLGYGAAMSRWKADAMALPRQATAVIERLSNEPSLLEGPLILIGHSLGGLVIKFALQHGMSRDVERHKELASNIKGIVFVGTPHFGSKLATVAAWSHFMRANPQVSDLRLDDANLETLNQYFLKLRGDLSFKTRIFMETQPVRLPWWLGGRLFPGVTIVSPMSSEAHIPGEVGIPIETNHITICKPKDRNAAIHSSLLAFIREVNVATTSSAKVSSAAPLDSELFEAISPVHRADSPVHLAFSAFGVNLDANTDSPICTSVCVVTDAPDRLRQQLQQIRVLIQEDPLVNAAAKKRVQNATLEQLVEDSGTRAVVLRELAVFSFSAYTYYCFKEEFNQLSPEERVHKLFVIPLIHRLNKKGEVFVQVHSRLADLSTYLTQAAAVVLSNYHRSVDVPRLGAGKYAILEELAALIAHSCALHLAAPDNAETATLFENFRTRIRFAENVVTGEKHKRDLNPLP